MQAEHASTDSPDAIGIIGTGPVARALGRLLYERGEPVTAVASRSSQRAEQAAAFMGSRVRPSSVAELPSAVKRIVIATSDDIIASVADALAAANFDRGLALHTCGALGPEALAPIREKGVACGVFHPLQSIVDAERAEESLKGITFGTSGDAAACEWGEHLARSLGGRAVVIAANQMPAYHAGAVLASNALVAVMDAALVLMGQAGIGAEAALEAIGPLSRTTLENVLRLGPERALTGPIVRGNPGTIASHSAALASAPADVAALYRAASRRLLDIARRRGLPESSIQALAAALERSHAGETDGYETRPNA